MISPVLLFIIFSIVAFILVQHAFSRPKNFPPGPWGVPLLGAYAYLLYCNYKQPYKVITEWKKKYNTTTVGFYVGKAPTVFVGDEKSIREVMFRNEFDGRPDPYWARLRAFGQKLGIFFPDGDYWLVQRRFTLRYLRDFGFGRRMQSLEDVLDFEIREMNKLIEYGPTNIIEQRMVKTGGLVKFPDIFNVGFINAYVAVLTDSHLPPEERKVLLDTGKAALQLQRNADALGGIISILPWLRFITPNWSRYNGIVNGNQGLVDMAERLISNNKKNLTEGKDHGFIDVYLKEMEQKRKNGDTSFTDKQLLMICVDLMLPASSAVSETLSFAVEFLILYPEIQEKFYQEIISVVGTGRLPTLDDRPNLPYCEATLREVMRYETLTPFGIPHKALEDTTLNGYFIPKGTMVVTNLWELHTSKEVWGDPENFRPERFLESNGKITKKDRSIPFGLGRRVCAGETFARNNMFLLLTGLYQNFKVVPAPGYPKPDVRKHMSNLIVNTPGFWAKCIPRNI